MTRPLALILLMSALLLGCETSSAQAWSVNTHVWLKPQITYRADGAQARRVARYAARAWRRTGVRFAPVREGADVTVKMARGCGGEATVGSRFPAYVVIGTCNRAPRRLLAVHEFGHVLGLSHEDRRCSRMNSYVLRDGTPDRCARHPATYWLRHPLTPDDVAGARWIQAQASRLRMEAGRR